MKFRQIRPWTRFGGQLEDWAKTELGSFLTEFFNGMRRLNFADNFESFQVTVTIVNDTEKAIPNELPVVPSKFVVVRNTAGHRIGDGPTKWTNATLYLKNYEPDPSPDPDESTTVTVIFMR